MAQRVFSDNWKFWIWNNVHRNCSKDDIFGILLQNGFAYDDIREELGYYPKKQESELLKVPVPSVLTEIALNPNSKLTANIQNATHIVDERVQMYSISDFLTKAECLHLISIIKENLKPSEITYKDEVDKNYRTSKTCYLSKLDNPFIAKVNKKICDVMGIDEKYGEEIQGQHYEVGQEFKKHTDWFEPNTTEYEQYASERGQRTWTFMLYLNITEEGGETYFPILDKTFKPKRGKAVIWNNLYKDGTPNHDTLHQGMPIIKGSKTIITKWFREDNSEL